MKRLQNYILTLIALLCLTASTLAQAAESLHTDIKGITGDELINVQERLNVIAQAYGTELSTADIQDFYQQVSENTRKAMQPFGYFKARVNAQMTHTNHTWTIHINIAPGPQIHIAKVDLQITGPGSDNKKIQHFGAHFPLAAGQVFLANEYEKAKEKLFQIANNQGYIKAELEKKEIRVNLKTDTAIIILHFATGPRYYFGRITFSPSPFAPSFLQRFVRFHPNEPFSSQKLLVFEQNLRNSHYFQQAEAKPELDQVNDFTVPVNVAVTAPKSQRYDIGVGYGTYTGPRLTLGTDFRRVTNTGQHFNAQLKISEVLSSLTAKYYIPGNNPLTDQYTIGANIQHFAPKNGTSFSQTLSGSYAKTHEKWQRTFTLNYLNERFRVENEPTHISQVLYPSMTLAKIKADNLLFPRFGSMVNFSVQGSSSQIFSKTTFLQSEIKGKYIFSPTKNSRAIVRGDLGYTITKNLVDLPLSLRYFAGGLSTIRGYPYSTIGPGKYLEIASAELQHKIIGNWYGAVFYDIGNASDTFNGVFNAGTGLGVIYQSFIGPVQFYVGRAMSKRGKPVSMEFSIGPDF